MIEPKAVADDDPQVIVVPLKPLSLETYSEPFAGVLYPVSFCSVQPVGGVSVAGLAPLPTTPSVGFAESAAMSKSGAGVLFAGMLVSLFDCLTESMPVLFMPDTRATEITAPVAASGLQSNVTVIADAAASALETKQ